MEANETDPQSRSAAEDSEWDEMLRQRYARFRVLILGRANAGKTTILERICGGSVDEAVVYRDGKKVLLHFLYLSCA